MANMEKLQICRICLVENVRMYIVNDKDLQGLYETLTKIPFVTEDRRPMLACVFCFAKLKQCCQLQRKCLEAEELFAQMMNEPNPSVNRGQLTFSSGLTITPGENINIVDVSHIESIVVKEELPDVCERLDDVIEPKLEPLEYELELEPLNNSYSDAEDVPPQQPESEDNVTLIEIKTEVEEEQEVSRKKRRASDTTRAAVAKKQKQQIKGKKLEDIITENQKKNTLKSGTTDIQDTINCTPKLISKTQDTHDNISVTDSTLDTNNTNIKKRNLIKHIRVHTGEKPFKCDVCQTCFSEKGNLTRHIRTHTGEKPYKCEECQLCFSQKGHLTIHIRTHTGDKPYKCEECQLCFKEKGNLTRHIRTHTGEKPYKCQECQRCFNTKNNLITHIRTHTGEKPFKCEECQLCFKEKGHLTRHIRTHTGAKPYKCEECQLTFTQKTSLTNHSRMHTGERPYKCEECQICFTRKALLLDHIRTHTGEKPYKCEECLRCFTQKSSLTKHIRTHTGAKP